MKPIFVTAHAVEQLRQRRPRTFGQMERLEVAEKIRLEVAAGIRASRLLSRKPVAFRLHREKKAGALPEGQRLVTNADGDLAWVVALEAEYVVITTLTRARAA